MRRTLVGIVLLCIAMIPTAAVGDHVPPFGAGAAIPGDVPVVKRGDARFVKNVHASGRGVAAPFGEVPPFVRDGRRYAVHSSTTYGLSVLDVTDLLDPVLVSEYSAAFGCPDAHVAAAARNRFGAFTALGGFENDLALTNDGRIAILGADDTGRCHDPFEGGLELVDLSDVRNPRTLHMVRNVGMAHSVTADPKRPWILWVSTSDRRDFIDLVDFRSCLGGVAQIAACKPVVARIDLDADRMPGLGDPGNPLGDKAPYGCHDIRFRGDRAYCAAITSTMIFDTSRYVDANGNLTGSKLACTMLDAERAPGVRTTDCMRWTDQHFDANGLAPANVSLVSVITHDDSKIPEQDIEIAHQAEAIADGTIMIVTDERGGGLFNGQGCPGGGVWFYDIRDERNPELMRTPDGGLGVYITRTPAPEPIASSPSCTVHYGGEFADENLLVFAWYSLGTRAVRYTADFTRTPATVAFDEVAAYLPAGAVTIQTLPIGRNPDDADEVLVYTSDAVRGIDVLGIRTPRVARSQAIVLPTSRRSAAVKPAPTPPRSTHVLAAAKVPLPSTGVGSNVAMSVVALAAALGLAAAMKDRSFLRATPAEGRQRQS